MTTVVAAFCPWTASKASADGVTMIADCRLSVEKSPGIYVTYSDEARKLFRLGKFVLAGYSGSRRSARFALARLENSLPKESPISASHLTEAHIRRALHKGAVQAQNVGQKQDRKQCGPFRVFIGFMDSAGQFSILTHEEGAGSKLYYAAVRQSDGRERILVMGSGMVATADYMTSLNRLVGESTEGNVDKMPFIKQSAMLGLALLDVLELRKLPLSGGGAQAMSLTREGVQAWEIRTSAPEYASDPMADPNWIRHGPEHFTE
jgi:hypothetical protein